MIRALIAAWRRAVELIDAMNDRKAFVRCERNHSTTSVVNDITAPSDGAASPRRSTR